MGLLDPSSVRRLAAALDLRPSKQRGQNFVIDPNTVRRIVALSGATHHDVVLEIGPGLGSLTLALLEVAAEVTAIEVEERLAERLPRTVEERMGRETVDRLRVVTADALRVLELPDPAPTIVVANLPYNVSVPVLLHLLAHFPSWTSALVMVQREVANRLVAPPGSKTYGVPSAKVAWYAAASTAGTVPAKVFWPVPNVESGLVRIERRDPPVTDVAREKVFAVIDAAFGQRRKMLRAALAPLLGSATEATRIIEAAGMDPQARGEVLDVAQFASIASAWEGSSG